MSTGLGMAGMGVASLLSGLLGGKNKGTSTTTTESSPTGYTSPYLGLLDSYLFKNILNKSNQFNNFGVPKGMQTTGSNDWLNDIMALLEKEWPTIMSGYNESAYSADCVKRCKTQYVGDQTKITSCINSCPKHQG